MSGTPVFEADSREERLFLAWAEEAKAEGFVREIQFRPAFSLSPRVAVMVPAPVPRNPNRVKEKFLLHPHEYTADFLLVLEPSPLGGSALDVATGCKRPLYYNKGFGLLYAYVDVKGGFACHRSRNSTDVTFPVNQKWVYDKYKILINKAVVAPGKSCFFKEYWAPAEAFVTDKGNPSIVYRECRVLGDVVGAVAPQLDF